MFYDKVLDDPILAPVFAHMSDKHREHVALWLGEVFGGPSRYTDELGGYPAMLSITSTSASPRSSGPAGPP